MTAIHANESFLLAQFREFYTEVIRLKQLIKTSGGMSPVDVLPPTQETPANGNGHAATAKLTGKLPIIDTAMLETLSGSEKITSLAVRGGLDSASEPSTEQTRLTLLVWQNLIALFRRNAVQILRAAGKPTDNYFEAQYVMAAFADDVFIHLDWEGRRAWTSNLLEATLFQSHVAGEMFFEKLDRLLRDRDPADKSSGRGLSDGVVARFSRQVSRCERSRQAAPLSPRVVQLHLSPTAGSRQRSESRLP